MHPEWQPNGNHFFGDPSDSWIFKERALQQEVKAILERVAETLTMREARRVSERWRRRLDGRSYSDSAQLIREDRDSR
jgi:hypothetical protein